MFNLSFVVASVAACAYVITLALDVFFDVRDDWSFRVIVAVYAISYIILGYGILKEAFWGIYQRDFFNENSLMGIASLGAWFIGDGAEAVAIVLFYRVGEYLQDFIVGRSKRLIRGLQDMKIQTIRIKRGDCYQEVMPHDVQVGDVVVVFAGERIGVDGIVLFGESQLDLSALNGESIPAVVTQGEEVLSGALNLDSVLHIQATHSYADSTLSKIIDLIESGNAQKSHSEEFITRFARAYTPIVVGIALFISVVPPLVLSLYGGDIVELLRTWGERGLIFLVVSCPCALVISIPLSFFVSLAKASRQGILIKGSLFLERLYHIKTFVFDKTGTLTKGSLSICGIKSFEGYSADDVLSLAGSLESHSNHPIAKAIADANSCPLLAVQSIQEYPGGGLCGILDNQKMWIGNARFLRENGIDVIEEDSLLCNVYLAVDGRVVGILHLADSIKDESSEVVCMLKTQKKDIVMLSGDRNAVVQNVAQKIGIEHFYGDLLPASKVAQLQDMQSGDRKVAFVGDGINDAPSLAISDIGIAMGKRGSDIALENADIVIMDDDMRKIPLAVEIAKKTQSILWENIIFALGTKGLIMICGAAGIANIWMALFGDVGVALLALLNATRALR